jgi:hypothetical protein
LMSSIFEVKMAFQPDTPIAIVSRLLGNKKAM